MRKPSESYLKLKKATDKILSGAGLVVLSPVFAGIAIAIKLEDGITAPVFFKQKRVGIHKSHFMLYKFRSMQTDTPHDMPTHLLTDPEQYLTGTGRWLRKTSLDELPQLLNIFQGDMALVGPRPALWNQYDLLEERDKYGANDVCPGLTGWAQIHGRDELEIEEKARLDGYYVKHLNLFMDIRCILGTIRSVLKSEGVVEGGTGAMQSECNDRKKKLLIVTNHSYMLYRFRKELIQKLQEDYEIAISTPFVGHEEDLRNLGVRCIETDVERRRINPFTDILYLMGRHSKQLFGEGVNAGKVITYAACAGFTTVKGLQKYGIFDEVSTMLRENFACLSVRDQNTFDMVESLTGKKPKIHLDPVLVADFSPQIVEKNNLTNYLVVYSYEERMSNCIGERDIIQSFAHKHGLKTVSIGNYQTWTDMHIPATPFELLGYLKNADYIITDTFHGTVFSIILEKKFATLLRESNAQKLGNLLCQFGLSDRQVKQLSELEQVVTADIDYNVVNSIRKKGRKEALEYLKAAVEN